MMMENDNDRKNKNEMKQAVVITKVNVSRSQTSPHRQGSPSDRGAI